VLRKAELEEEARQQQLQLERESARARTGRIDRLCDAIVFAIIIVIYQYVI
jgi:hypothetical protein